MPGISGNAPSGNSALFQQLCKHTASHLHRALWAEFLTAEAVDTGLPVNIRLAAAHCDGFGRTDIGAFFAADAGACAKLGVRRKHMEQEAVGKLGENTLSAAAEKDACLRGDSLVVRDGKRGRFTENRQLFRTVRAQAAPDGSGAWTT